MAYPSQWLAFYAYKLLKDHTITTYLCMNSVFVLHLAVYLTTYLQCQSPTSRLLSRFSEPHTLPHISRLLTLGLAVSLLSQCSLYCLCVSVK